MKIIKFTIKGIRGIKDEIELEPNGENMVISGLNGTGKSSVVDAIEFLFTGDISRLSGRGTRGLTLKDHGKHIETKPKDAYVKAVIAIDGVDGHVDIKRTMSRPKVLVVPKDMDPAFAEALKVAERGYNFLSRSDILRYIASEPGKRAEDIQAVLNLDKVGHIRKIFGTINRDAYRSIKAASDDLQRAISDVYGIFGVNNTCKNSDDQEEDMLDCINNYRVILGGDPLETLDLTKLRTGIAPVEAQERKRRLPIDPVLAKHNIEGVRKAYHEIAEKIYYEDEKELEDLCEDIKNKDDVIRLLEKKQLFENGLLLLDGSSSCPLCMSKCAPEWLEMDLKSRIEEISEVEAIDKKIKSLSSSIANGCSRLLGYLDRLRDTASALGQSGIRQDIMKWSESIRSWVSAITRCDYRSPYPELDEQQIFLAVSKFSEHLSALDAAAESLEKQASEQSNQESPERNAWSALTVLEYALKKYFTAKEKFESANAFSKIASVLDETYTKTKDNMLSDLFESVSNDFSNYYQYINSDDEKNFSASLTSDGSKLDLNVDFHGRGSNSPIALHSEGHQDSMGLCLYLSLVKNVLNGKVNFIVLDDVLASIDERHKLYIVNLLKKSKDFSNMQFFMTTHSAGWVHDYILSCPAGNEFATEKNIIAFDMWDLVNGVSL
jgi:DNA repair exonuclease SbcCD ATPase subunit